MNAGQFFVLTQPSYLPKPIIEPCKNSKNCPHRQYLMKMSNYIISVMQSDIDARISKNHSCYPTQRKKKNKTQGKKYWSCYFNRTLPYCSKPRKNLNAGWNRDDYCRRCKISSRIHIQAHTVHVVRPNNKT